MYRNIINLLQNKSFVREVWLITEINQPHVSANAAVAIIRLDTVYPSTYIDTYTNTNNCSVLYHIYTASLINCIQPDDGHSSTGRNM